MRIGIALGSGGARGLAHIAVLEVLEQMGIRPCRIAGTSIGAVVGAAYASGASVAELKNEVNELVHLSNERLQAWFQNPERPIHWLQFLAPEWGSAGLLQADEFLQGLKERFQLGTFDSLSIPLQVVAGDFQSRAEVVLAEGEVITAVQASMAVPGIFTPVTIRNRLLVDGGSVNPVPFDLLFDDCDLTIAVDVMGQRAHSDDEMPNFLEVVLASFQIMQRSIIDAKMQHRTPDLYVAPEIHGVRTLEFNKADQIFAETRPACDQLRKSLEAIL